VRGFSPLDAGDNAEPVFAGHTPGLGFSRPEAIETFHDQASASDSEEFRMTDQTPRDSEPLQLLPMGYWLRLFVMLVLVVGGAVCAVFYNELVGGVMAACAPLFSKFSGFQQMHKKHKAELATYKAANPRG
jgi:hypothetical protein